MKVSIATVQFFITHLDVVENFARIEGYVGRAAEASAQVVVFPEDCITGSIFGDVRRLDTTYRNRDAFCQLARKYAIDIVSGSSMEGTAEGNFNTSYYINAQGEVLGTYRKNHLYHSERAFLTSGVEVPVFETAYGKAGIVICWDMLFPEVFERMKKRGVQIIYCPSYWYCEIAETMVTHNPNSEGELLNALCLTRAVETNAVIVYCNAAGVMKNPNGSVDTLIGHSQVVMPVLGAMQRCEDNAESMFVTTVDLGLLETSGKIYAACL